MKGRKKREGRADLCGLSMAGYFFLGSLGTREDVDVECVCVGVGRELS